MSREVSSGRIVCGGLGISRGGIRGRGVVATHVRGGRGVDDRQDDECIDERTVGAQPLADGGEEDIGEGKKPGRTGQWRLDACDEA